MAARNFIPGARAAVYRGAAVLFGAEDGAARNGYLELGLPCIGKPPCYLCRVLGSRRIIWCRGGQEDGRRRRREGGGCKIEI